MRRNRRSSSHQGRKSAGPMEAVTKGLFFPDPLPVIIISALAGSNPSLDLELAKQRSRRRNFDFKSKTTGKRPLLSVSVGSCQ